MFVGTIGTRQHAYFSVSLISDKIEGQAKKIFDAVKDRFPPLSEIDSLVMYQNMVICHQKNGIAKRIDLDPALQKQLHGFHKVSWICDRLYVDNIIKTQNKNILYLYSSGGSGHKSAKEALIERDLSSILEQINPHHDIAAEHFKSPAQFVAWCKKNHFIHENDVMIDFLGDMGAWAAAQWDEAQKNGDVDKLEKLASKQWLSDFVFGAPVYFSTLKQLKEIHPDHIVCTQAMALPAVLSAVSTYNLLYRPGDMPEVKLKLYMTDMPTEYASHFFDALKRIPQYGGGKCYLELYAPKSISPCDWQSLAGLDLNQIILLENEELPVRHDFLAAASDFRQEKPPKVHFKVSCEAEYSLLQATLGHQGDHVLVKVDNGASSGLLADYVIPECDHNFFLMLGSHPTEKAVKSYVDKFIAIAKEHPEAQYNLFAFAGKFNVQDPNGFYQELCRYIQKQSRWPQNLRVIPLSYQDPAQLVSLELQCHTITRSGGSTAMELLVLDSVSQKIGLSPKCRFIHVQKVPGRSLLEDSIPLWEKGNFFFLEEQLGAEVITPDLLKLRLSGKAKAAGAAVKPKSFWLGPLRTPVQERLETESGSGEREKDRKRKRAVSLFDIARPSAVS